VLGATRTSLLLVEPEGGALRVAAAHGAKVPPEEMDPVRVGEAVAGLALARGEALLVADVATDERFAGRVPVERYASRSFAVAPLVAGRPLGVLCATDRPAGAPFDEDDLALLRILAVQTARMLLPAGRDAERAAGDLEAAAAAEGGFAADALAGRSDDAELARAVCEALTAEVDPGRLLEAVLRAVAERLGAAPVSLFLAPPGDGPLAREAECDGGRRADRATLARGRGLTGAVFETGRLVASDAPQSDPRFDPAADTPEDGRPGPLLCGPLRFRGKTLGVFRVFPERAETAAPATGEVLAAALSAAVRNVLLYRSLVDTIEEVAQARRDAGR
jgi:GAF domain-containing protein